MDFNSIAKQLNHRYSARQPDQGHITRLEGIFTLDTGQIRDSICLRVGNFTINIGPRSKEEYITLATNDLYEKVRPHHIGCLG